MSVMRVIVLHPFTKLEVRRPSRSEDILTVVLSCVAVKTVRQTAVNVLLSLNKLCALDCSSGFFAVCVIASIHLFDRIQLECTYETRIDKSKYRYRLFVILHQFLK